jgi:riboflavin biosynthesis pyrimidine reductase
LVEGGGTVARTFLDAGVVDRIELFLAPRVLAADPADAGGRDLHLVLEKY